MATIQSQGEHYTEGILPMFMRNRSFVATGAAPASAAAIVAASQAIVPNNTFANSGASAPPRLSTATVQLTALADITIRGINDAYWSGWGGYIGPTGHEPDVYYPNINPTGTSPVYVTGVSGVAYYIVDQALEQFAPINLDNYLFEVGSYYGGGKNAAGSGLSALIYVGANEIFGAKSPIAKLAKAIFYYGTPALINSTIVSLATLLPTVHVGLVKVGGGILASLYFTGQTPDGSFSFGSPGLSAVVGYIATSITDALPKGSMPEVLRTSAKDLAASTSDQTARGGSPHAAPAATHIATEPDTSVHSSIPTPTQSSTVIKATDSANPTQSVTDTKATHSANADPGPTATSTRGAAKSGVGSFKASTHSNNVADVGTTEDHTAKGNSPMLPPPVLPRPSRQEKDHPRAALTRAKVHPAPQQDRTAPPAQRAPKADYRLRRVVAPRGTACAKTTTEMESDCL